MFCNECGAKNPDGSKFCNACGHKMAPIERTEKPEFYETLDTLATFHPEESKKEAEEISEDSFVEEIPSILDEEPQDIIPSEDIPKEKEEKTVEENIQSVSNPMERLSTFKAATSNNEVKKVASTTLNPIEDEYWDDTKTEIEATIRSIPKENIIKICGVVIGLFIIMAWLIYLWA